LHNALTGAITIILSVTAITVISQVMGYTEEARTTLCMISTGIASLCMIKQVYPLESNLRKLVYGVMFGLFLFGMLFMQGLLSLIDLTYQQSIIILIFVIIAQHTVAVTSRVLGWFKQLWRKRRILKAMKRNINP
ncbi:MAG: hypothetical protein LBQ48_01255, partial [Oscillospiraceae bacterium]|nr:hypothetical protein [Oscillospiraceae bacterium]